MAEMQSGKQVRRYEFSLRWWQSWVGRFALHLPWLFCAFAYFKFLGSEQGQTALEFPVERPLVGVLIVYVLLGMNVRICWLLTLVYRNASLRAPLVTLGWTMPVGRASSPLTIEAATVPSPPCTLWPLANFVVLGAALGGGILTVAARSVPVWLGLLLGVLSCLAGVVGWVIVNRIEVVLQRLMLKAPEGSYRASILGFVSAAYAVALAIAVYASGIYLVTHHIDALTSVGSHALVASGLLTLTLLCQGLLFLLVTLASLRAGWLLCAIGAVVYMMQSPIEERSNPLLVRSPTVENAQTTCAQLAAKTQITSDPQAAQPSTRVSSPILVSAEGGGIRAAYWTAVSLEELSQARERPLLKDTIILSGVSGGSLGVATFLAAQELPLGARLPCIREFLSGDFLSPFVAGLLFVDVPRLILPARVLSTHRGDYFEDFVARRWLILTKSDYFYRPLAQVAGDGQGHAAVYLNATDALSGQYIALAARQTDGASAPEQPNLSALNLAILKRLPDLRIAQAVHMSARFPYLSPNPDLRMPATEASPVLFKQTASTLGAAGRVSVASLVDGGYFDNSGLWPALRLLESARSRSNQMAPFVIHIVNDQTRGCSQTPGNTGCIHAQSRQLNELRNNRGGWLSRPLEALDAVRSEHSRQSLMALELAQLQSDAKPRLVWQVPMPEKQVTPIDWFLDLVQWLPFHGRDLRFGGVALAWTLAPQEREFLCVRGAAIRTTGTPGIRKSEPVDRSKECSSAEWMLR